MDLFNEAQRLHEQGRYAEAEPIYDTLLTQNHANPGLLATVGTLYLQTQRMGLAITLLEHAIKLGLKQSDALSNLGLAYKYTGQRDKAMKAFNESVAVEPTAKALANYSAMFVETGEDEKCKVICKRAIDLDPSHPIAHWNLALTLLAEGKWDQAWDEAEWGMVNNVMRVNRNIGGDNMPAWDGSPGKRICIYGEQGLGDEIMFASMLPDVLKTNEVVLECSSGLSLA